MNEYTTLTVDEKLNLMIAKIETLSGKIEGLSDFVNQMNKQQTITVEELF